MVGEILTSGTTKPLTSSSLYFHLLGSWLYASVQFSFSHNTVNGQKYSDPLYLSLLYMNFTAVACTQE